MPTNDTRMKKRVRRLLRLAIKKAKKSRPCRYRLRLLRDFREPRGPRSFAFALLRRPAVFWDLVALGMIAVTGELAVTTAKGAMFLERYVVECDFLLMGVSVYLTVEPLG